jgi:hypothetical protein
MPVNVTGVKQLQKAMRAVDDDLFKEMNTSIKAVMLPIRDKARGFLPRQDEVLSGWGKATASVSTANYRAFPAYDYQTAKTGIKYKAGSISVIVMASRLLTTSLMNLLPVLSLKPLAVKTLEELQAEDL